MKGVSVLLIVMLAGLAFVSWWMWKETGVIQQTRERRAAVKTRILQEVKARYRIPIVNAGLDSHCGKTVYTVELGGRGAPYRRLHFDIDTGLSVTEPWMANCLRYRLEQ